MQTQTPNHQTQGRPRRLAVIVGAAFIAIAAVGAWVALSTGDADDDGRTIATELADKWSAGWSDDDPEAVTSVFADDGVFFDVYDPEVVVTQAEMLSYAATYDVAINNLERVSDLTMTDAGTYTWVGEWDHRSMTQGWVRERGVIEIELDGDLASRIEVLEFEVIEVLD